MPFVFYDFETSGLSPEFDQVLQVAAVKTDDQFNELDSFSLRCRLASHIVPSPGALLANRIGPSMLTDAGLPSYYEALTTIQAKFVEWSPAIFIGYNSIDFDEMFLRQGFFQTLQPIYLTNTGGNARGDVLKIMHATAIYAPSVLKVPRNDSGDPTYKLDQIAPANGYGSGGHHEAMGDVRATLFLANLVKKRAGAIWEHMVRWTRKRSVSDFMTQEDAVWHSGIFGRNKAYSWLIAYCGQNSERDSQLAGVDLQFDPKEVIGLSVEELVKVFNSNPKKIRAVATNRQPILMPRQIVPADGTRPKVCGREIQARVALVQRNPDFQQRVSKALAGRFAEAEPSEFVEQRIYGGFSTRADEKVMETFHSTSWDERMRLVESLEDERAHELGQRLIYLEQPEVLPKSLRKQHDKWLKDRILNSDPEVPWMTLPKALEEVGRLLADSTESEEKKFLKDVKTFLEDLRRRVE
jgi:exodeoxyribonuclease-1